MRTDPASRKKNARGQALLEFALSVPVLLLLLAICLDFGRLYLFDLSLRDAAWMSARYAAMNPNDDAGIRDAAVAAGPRGAFTTGAVTITPALGPRSSGQPVEIKITYTFRALTPILSSLVGSSIVLTEHQTDIVK